MKPTDISIRLGGGTSGLPDGKVYDSVDVPLAKMPHILVAGMTGSGKSVAVHDILIQLITYPARWSNLVLIDPKRVELGQYAGLPHLAWPWVAYELDEIENALKWAEAEMRMRFNKMERGGVRSFDDMREPWARTVVVIDELANLVLARKSLSKTIVSIASMGRAAGIHLLLATQRPSADVISPLIRANVPTRIALPVITSSESRVILDVDGAEELESPGDMLIRLPAQRELFRTRGRFVTDEDINRAVREARLQGAGR